MYIDLAQLEEGTTSLDFVDSPESYSAKDPSLKLVQPIAVHISITKNGNHIIVSGEASTTAELICSRCLNPVEYPTKTEFTAELHPKLAAEATPNAVGKKKKGYQTISEEEASEINIQEEGETDIIYYSTETLDLSEEVRQYIELSIPMQPLCKENCAGLCPRCGTNLNKGKCCCPTTELENPFTELKQKITLKSKKLKLKN